MEELRNSKVLPSIRSQDESSPAEMVVGVPWRTSDDDPKVDGERREVTVLEPVEKELLRSERSRPVPRNVYISKADLETYGYTSGASGVVPF